MAHPRMYDENDPLLARVRPVCLAFPESHEVEAWGRPTFRAGRRMFAIYDGSEEHPYALVFKPEGGDRDALLQDPRFYVPAYHGASGWLGIDLVATPPAWQEIAELAEGSYRQVALKRMLKALDAR